jgi:NAD(P)-dependent dehydrogenase (short-subunit alcohol dehydrogenase family)
LQKKVAVVSGGNRGIGLEICRQLAQHGDVEVILTARDTRRGQDAVETLQTEGLDVQFQRLEVTDLNNVRRLVKHIADHKGRLDILVNNAGIYNDRGLRVSEVDLGLVRQTFETNFYGPLRLCQMFLPLMERNNYGRIVNVSSSMGSLQRMGGRAVGYRASKAALNALTRVLAAETEGHDILVNSVDPGWVRTDMGGERASRSVEQGADTAVWLATLPAGGPNGGFFRDREPVPW